MPSPKPTGPSVSEKRLRFHFGPNWQAQKHDDTAHHRSTTNHSLAPKGCDIVALAPEGQGLWLIEVKDYRLVGQPPSADALAPTVLQKFRDTLASLIGMGQLGQPNEKAFAKACLSQMGRGEHLNLVLRLEMATGSRLFSQRANLQDSLKRGASGFTTKARIFIEGGNFTQKGPWTVTPAPAP